MRRILGALAVLFGIAGLVVADDTRGTIVKVEDGSITVRVGGGGFGKKKGEKAEEKTFKVSKDIKIVRVVGKDKEDVKLTLDELKTAIKVTNVFATITHDGDNGTEIKIGGFGGGFGKKDKGKPKTKPKDD